MKKKTVFVGMSGGVDSSVAALLLQQQGYQVIGVFIKVWHPDFLSCHWEAERLDAMRVAAHLEIPFLTCDAEAAYKKDVAEHFIEEYRKGRTPNPDVMCNTHIKFGHFFAFAQEHGADYIATGHYAQVQKTSSTVSLFRGKDTEKDQSYFLWNISKDALAHTLFPVGHLTKPEVRRIAEKAKLPTAQKDDSQGICFLGHVDMFEFLSHYIELRDGEVRDENGAVIGSHKGVALYTEGQRHGFSIFPNHTHTTPYFISSKNIAENILVVSHEKRAENIPTQEILLSHVQWSTQPPLPQTALFCQTRYRQRSIPVSIISATETEARIVLNEHAETPSPGQSCVFYQDKELIGGGIIEPLVT